MSEHVLPLGPVWGCSPIQLTKPRCGLAGWKVENLCEKVAEVGTFIRVIGEAAQLIWSDFSAPGPIFTYLYQPTSSNLGAPSSYLRVCVWEGGVSPSSNHQI